jgi:hypothetical protein
MINLVNALFYRLFRTKTIYIFIILCIALPLFSIVTTYAAQSLVEGLPVNDITGELGFTFDPLSMVGSEISFASDAAILSIICIAIFVASEFSYGTVHNPLISGKSRTTVAGAYGLVSAVIAIIITTLLFASYFFLGWAFLGDGGYTGAELASGFFMLYGLSLLSSLFATALTLLFVFATQKKSAAITLPLLICIFVPGILTTILSGAALAGRLDYNAISWVPIANVLFLDPVEVDGGLALKILLTSGLLTAGVAVWAGAIFNKKDIK